jgi:hypothetical protein
VSTVKGILLGIESSCQNIVLYVPSKFIMKKLSSKDCNIIKIIGEQLPSENYCLSISEIYDSCCTKKLPI